MRLRWPGRRILSWVADVEVLASGHDLFNNPTPPNVAGLASVVQAHWRPTDGAPPPWRAGDVPRQRR